MRITFVIAGGQRGTALIVDSSADPAPLVAAIEDLAHAAWPSVWENTTFGISFIGAA